MKCSEIVTEHCQQITDNNNKIFSRSDAIKMSENVNFLDHLNSERKQID